MHDDERKSLIVLVNACAVSAGRHFLCVHKTLSYTAAIILVQNSTEARELLEIEP